ncbi:MAG: wyosine base formation protein [Frankiales bacterium]|nr:wyosine base formation protein [Frankiales bacterium]
MKPDLSSLLRDLQDEHAALDARVCGLTEEQWRTPTPAEGWDVADCIAHLHYFDGTAVLALTDAAAFDVHLKALLGGHVQPGADVQYGRDNTGGELLADWRRGRAALVAATEKADPGARVPWYGPPMSLTSFASARLMETWAHGQDVSDALGLAPVTSDRLRHVCHIGVQARPYAYLVHGVDNPDAPVHVALTGPGAGEWGPPDAPDRITGTALDFALLVTQRRHLDDLSLSVEGDTAAQWASIAQAYAGPAGTGRKPLS